MQVGAEMAGTLKNIVALAAGFVDGIGAGANSKAAIMRQGLAEMRALSKALYPTVRDETFLESCGVADLIATCYGGRNRRVAAAWASARLQVLPSSPSPSLRGAEARVPEQPWPVWSRVGPDADSAPACSEVPVDENSVCTMAARAFVSCAVVLKEAGQRSYVH